ncbi:hypothetical protein LA303_09320 [Candidatus Sulfidibacterium hydrothermale]|uniref:hypothetical protein n=1 Tax=Candidatus Sulfidibacterium hydrothermale TaxID=2875962 RepID=UPI001F0A6CD4|nr:hypothetical protein [Candidatus Sulfidibacterium hydrothermale]UBM61612.1 hypothetical protein LA303_09320 [Candidatus Sulfidibacterium hydrothermale]
MIFSVYLSVYLSHPPSSILFLPDNSLDPKFFITAVEFRYLFQGNDRTIFIPFLFWQKKSD